MDNGFLHSRAIIYRVDGTSEDIEPENGSDFKGAELSLIVGGHFEHITLPKQPNKLPEKHLFINEDGKYLNLPVNKEATRIFSMYFPHLDDCIVGNAIICNLSLVR